MHRVVSLLPSATEILCLIGGGPLLVGRSHECDYPAGLGHLPILTGQRTSAASPADIDREVRESLRAGESLYTLDTELLARLRPDVILTQDLCDVCSIDLATVRRVAAGLSPPPEVVSLNPHTVEDVLDDVLRVGRAVGLEESAVAAVVALRERMFRAMEHVNAYDDGPSVAILEWTDPLFIAGHWTPQLVERAGGRFPLNPTAPDPAAGAATGLQVSARRAGKSRVISGEELVGSAPEFLIIAPCGMNMRQSEAAARQLAAAPFFDSLPAVRAGRVAVADGSQAFSRPGPRLVDALEFLVGFIQGRPEMIPASFPWGGNPARA